MSSWCFLTILSLILYRTDAQASNTYISTIYCSRDTVIGFTSGTVYYRLILTEEWLVTLDNCASSFDTQMKILDSSETDISTDLYCDGDDCGGTCTNFNSLREKFDIPLPSGTYYIQLNPYSSGGNYQIDITCAKITTQGTISCGQIVSGIISTATVIHYYQLTLSTDKFIKINDCNTVFNPTLLILNEEYYDISSGTYCNGASKGNDCGSPSCSSNAEEFRINTLAAGTYYIEISPYLDLNTGSYQIQLSCSNPSASTTACDTTISSTITRSTARYHKLTLNQLTHINLHDCNSAIDPTLIVMDSSFNDVSSGDECVQCGWCEPGNDCNYEICENMYDRADRTIVGGAEHFDITLSAGDYYLRMAPCCLMPGGNYEIQIDCIVPSFTPSKTPSNQPTPVPTDIPSKNPTSAPTSDPAAVPTPAHTDNPTKPPTNEPTPAPTDIPTVAPTDHPSATPTPAPTEEPTSQPTFPTNPPTNDPTAAPTDEPTPAPTDYPTSTPTNEPTPAPTDNPTSAPTTDPTYSPSNAPTAVPTNNPSAAPSQSPSVGPTLAPISEPSGSPTELSGAPSESPSNAPTAKPIKISVGDVSTPDINDGQGMKLQ